MCSKKKYMLRSCVCMTFVAKNCGFTYKSSLGLGQDTRDSMHFDTCDVITTLNKWCRVHRFKDLHFKKNAPIVVSLE